MPSRPFVARDNEFAAPPDYCAQWMTDFREDDNRFLDGSAPIQTLKDGGRIRRDTVTPMGPMTQLVTLEGPRQWSVKGEQRSPEGHRLLAYRIVETVAPKGRGTHHHVDIFLDEVAPAVEPMLPQIKAGWDQNLETIFANVKRELEAAFREGKAPTA